MIEPSKYGIPKEVEIVNEGDFLLGGEPTEVYKNART